MASVIDALKRLERAGSEESGATGKLKDAARELGEYVVGLLDEEVRDEVSAHDGITALPRDYRVQEGYGDIGVADFHLVRWDYATQRYIPVHASRFAALAFAEDVATGWLDELGEWLAARKAYAEEGAATLTDALTTMQHEG